MATDAQQQQYIARIQVTITALANLVDDAKVLYETFIDRGYDAAAADPITDADLANYGVVVYDLGTAINLLQELYKLYNGQATIVSAAYKPSANKWRSV